MYKLLLIDLDETLLCKDGNTICDENITAIKNAAAAGKYISICSGRSNMSIDKFNKKLGISGFTIGYNGGIIYKDGEVLICHYLEKQLVLDIIDFCRSNKVEVQLYQDEKFWIDKETFFTKQYCKRSMLSPEIVDDLKNHVGDRVNKLIILATHRKLKKLEKLMPDSIKEKCCTFFSHEYLYEFNPLNVTKGTAVKELANYLDIPIEQVIAIGDHENDIPMIKAAGLGVAVKNAIKPMLECADYITENDNNHGAVAEVINKFML